MRCGAIQKIEHDEEPARRDEHTLQLQADEDWALVDTLGLVLVSAHRIPLLPAEAGRFQSSAEVLRHCMKEQLLALQPIRQDQLLS